MTIGSALRKVTAGDSLTFEESEAVFQAIMNGAADNQGQIGALLTALKIKGESAEEIAGAAKVLRAKAEPFRAPQGTIDLCGTGGDGLDTLNISTAASFLVAACGVPVAKHGNRAVSSSCGSADVLEALDIKIEVAREVMEACLAETNFAFLFAPKYHPMMRRVVDVRKLLGFRTIFNLIGPLANPAQVKRQLIGVSSPELIPVFAKVTAYLGIEAMIVHGDDGMDEISITTKTQMRFQGKQSAIAPHDYYTLDAIEGGDAEYNAIAIRKLFLGEGIAAFREAACLNAAGGLLVAGVYDDFEKAYQAALGAIENRKAYDLLTRVIEMTQDEHA